MREDIKIAVVKKLAQDGKGKSRYMLSCIQIPYLKHCDECFIYMSLILPLRITLIVSALLSVLHNWHLSWYLSKLSWHLIKKHRS